MTIPLGSEVVVVQGVLTLDTAAPAQYVIVERSLTGTLLIPSQDSLGVPPRPPLPISGASVVVTRDDGDSVLFTEITDTLGVYQYRQRPRIVIRGAPPNPFFQAGRVYRLRVTTPDGHVVTGRTRMPNIPAVAGVPSDGATFDRDRDTLRVAWNDAPTSKGVFVQVRPRDLARRLTLLLFSDSSEFRIPGSLPLPFESDTIPPVVWVAGTRQTLTIAAMDTNFFNFFRTTSDPFTGSGFINSLQGGLGVFGSMAPVNRTYEVRGKIDHRFEGRYRLAIPRGGADSVTYTLDLYVNRDRPNSILVNALAISDDSFLCGYAFACEYEASGTVEGGLLRLWFYNTAVNGGLGDATYFETTRYMLRGTFVPEGTTTGRLVSQQGREFSSFVLNRLP